MARAANESAAVIDPLVAPCAALQWIDPPHVAVKCHVAKACLSQRVMRRRVQIAPRCSECVVEERVGTAADKAFKVVVKPIAGNERATEGLVSARREVQLPAR